MSRPSKRMLPTDDFLPDLPTLFKRHRGLTRAIAEYYAEAASVALARHHNSPTLFKLRVGLDESIRALRWPHPDSRTQDAFANRDDCTRDGAYSIALAGVEAELGWTALTRAETRTGADYYVGVPGTVDLEDAYRLEVSGIDEGDDQGFERRLAQKIQQTRRGASGLPAIACVVGFALKRIAIETAEEDR